VFGLGIFSHELEKGNSFKSSLDRASDKKNIFSDYMWFSFLRIGKSPSQRPKTLKYSNLR